MFATKVKGQVTTDRRLVVKVPQEVLPGEVELIILHDSGSKPAKKRSRRKAAHPAFGLWAKRNGINNAAEYAAKLRRMVESRGDGE